MSKGIDLHLHSIESDGLLSPFELVEGCVKNNVVMAALTDHDTAAGVPRFCAAAKAAGVRALTGAEFNVEYDGEMHILGYGFDMNNSRLHECMNFFACERENRMFEYINKLKKLKIELTSQEIKALVKGSLVGRPHIARALINKGYVSDMKEAFDKYLGQKGAAYCTYKKPASKEVIDVINSAGGVAVLAHPGLLEPADTDAIVSRLKEEGLYGIEAFYPAHTDEQKKYYEYIAMKHGLIVTCGSDFHGEYKDVNVGGEKRRSNYLEKCVERLFERFADCYPL